MKSGWRTDSSPQRHRRRTKSSPQGGGWRTEEGAYKYYKSLLDRLELPSLEALFKQIPEQQQPLWHVHDGRARVSLAAVAAAQGLAGLLAELNVQEPARSRIVARRPAPEEVVAWYLYAREEEGLAQPTSYLVRRLLEGDAPPLPQLQLASLSWEQWRTYAATVQWGGWPPDGAWPLFDVWVEHYGAQPAEGLPFGVGEGLAFLAAPAGSGAGPPAAREPAGPEADPEGAGLWQEVLAELALQMTKATFDAWLKDSRFVAREEGTVVVRVRNETAQQWLAHRLREPVERMLAALSGEELAVTFVAGEGAPASQPGPGDLAGWRG